MLHINQIAAQVWTDLFDVGAPGNYQVRVAWRAGKQEAWGTDPEAFALVQLWRDEKKV